MQMNMDIHALPCGHAWTKKHSYKQTENTHTYVGGTLIGEDGLVVMAGVELVEWYQIHQPHGLQVYDAIPFAAFQPLL